MRTRLQVPESLKDHPYLERFKKFHEDNTQVMRRIIEILEQHLDMEKDYASIDYIIGKIKYDEQMKVKGNYKYKINDAFTSIYARIIVHNFPKFKKLINIKKLRSV